MSVLFLVYDRNYAYFPAVDENIVTVENMWKQRKYQYCFWTKVLRKLKIPVDIWGKRFLGPWVNRIKEYQQVVIFDAVYEPMFGRWLKNKKVEGYIYMWDGKNRQRLSGEQLLPVLSFNPRDEKNGMIFQQTFFCKEILRGIEHSEKYDIYYCGRVKKRTDVILKYCTFFVKQGFSTCFHIVSGRDEKREEGIVFYEKELSYHENLVFAGQSKAILNIVDEEEFGTVTLRCLEALYLGKKLITNDTQIKNADFYNKNNIFILQSVDCEGEQGKELREFLDKEYETPPQSILEKYDIKNVKFGI